MNAALQVVNHLSPGRILNQHRRRRLKCLRIPNRFRCPNHPLVGKPKGVGNRKTPYPDEAERAGFQVAAEHLRYLAIRMMENPASLRT